MSIGFKINKRSLSLIEMMIALVLLACVFGTIGHYSYRSINRYTEDHQVKELQQLIDWSDRESHIDITASLIELWNSSAGLSVKVTLFEGGSPRVIDKSFSKLKLSANNEFAIDVREQISLYAMAGLTTYKSRAICIEKSFSQKSEYIEHNMITMTDLLKGSPISIDNIDNMPEGVF